MATEEAKEEAASLKKEGNICFQDARYAEAVAAYTRSIELNPSDHLLFSNRSAAYLKLGESAIEALADAEKCIELAPTWSKGYSRQASALQELKRWDEAVVACQKGQSVSSGEGLQKMLEEVRMRQFQCDLQGTWHGTVKEQLGGYEQEMEFLSGSVVRVAVLGRSINGLWWVDPGPSPFHLNIRVPAVDVPQTMGPPPPVPYIAKIDEAGLHLCCPVLRMDRPDRFEGDGYCLMKRGPLQSADDSEVVGLTHEEKLLRCVQELTDAVPDTQLKEISHLDTDDTAREKVMLSVRFESAMYAVQKRFGEAVMKEVLEAAKTPQRPHDVLSNTKAMRQLTEKLRASGVLGEEDQPTKSVTTLPTATPVSSPAASAPAFAAAPSTEQGLADTSRSSLGERNVDSAIGGARTRNSSAFPAATVALSVTAALAAAIMLWRRQRR